MKETLYTTAVAKIACAHFQSGEIVSVKFSHRSNTGIDWYRIERTEHGPLKYPVMYPAHHLKDFVL